MTRIFPECQNSEMIFDANNDEVICSSWGLVIETEAEKAIIRKNGGIGDPEKLTVFDKNFYDKR